MVVLDVNGGPLDVVNAELEGTEDADLFLASGSVLPAPSVFSLGLVAASLLTAELDQDGDDDLIASSFTEGAAIFLQDSADALIPKANPNLLRHISAVADLDQDNILDLVAAQDSLSWQKGNGDGSFQDETVISAGLCNGASARDLDGDGALDLVCASASAELLVFLGDGLGGFSALATLPLPGIFAGPLRVDDLDQDGALDLFASKGSLIVIGNGDGTFHSPQPLDTVTNLGNFSGLFFSLDSLNLSGDATPEIVMLGSDGDAALWIYTQRP